MECFLERLIACRMSERALGDTRLAAPHGQVHMHRGSSLISNPAVESWMEKARRGESRTRPM